MIALIYRLELQQPVLVTSLDGDPNSAVTFPYLPGSVLRGAMLHTYMNRYGQFDAQNEEVRRLFFNGQTRYLNGYPVLDERRMLPVPNSWRMDKEPGEGKENTIADFSVPKTPNLNREQRLRQPFWANAAEKVLLHEPAKQINVHTQRARPKRDQGKDNDKDYGRARKESGAVYRYEALEKRQTFEAVILCDNDEDADVLEPLLAGECFLGGSRSAGYGLARIVFLRREQNGREVEGWKTEQTQTAQEPVSRITVTLLSPALIRNEFGDFAVSLEAVALALKARLGDAVEFSEVPDATFIRGTVIGGFNRTWGLPLPQTPAVEMGSVFVFKSPGLTPDQIETLEQHGIGERRAEALGAWQ